jgi:hypothetical protein
MLQILIAFTFILSVMSMIRYKRLTMPFKILSLYFIFELLVTIFDQWEIAKYKHNTITVHIETSGTYIFFGLIYYFLFKNKYIKASILTSIVLVTAFSVANAFFVQKYDLLFPSYIMMITEILCIIFAVMLFNKMLLYPTEINIIKQSTFWLNTAVIIYNSSLFLNSALANYYPGHWPIDFFIIKYFWYGTIFLFYFFLVIAILTDKKEISATNADVSYTNTE